MLQFNITAQKNASGWYELPLSIDYERQVDVSVSGGEVSPSLRSGKAKPHCSGYLWLEIMSLCAFLVSSPSSMREEAEA